jgi:hypothetical protein
MTPTTQNCTTPVGRRTGVQMVNSMYWVCVHEPQKSIQGYYLAFYFPSISLSSKPSASLSQDLANLKKSPTLGGSIRKNIPAFGSTTLAPGRAQCWDSPGWALRFMHKLHSRLWRWQHRERDGKLSGWVQYPLCGQAAGFFSAMKSKPHQAAILLI